MEHKAFVSFFILRCNKQTWSVNMVYCVLLFRLPHIPQSAFILSLPVFLITSLYTFQSHMKYNRAYSRAYMPMPVVIAQRPRALRLSAFPITSTHMHWMSLNCLLVTRTEKKGELRHVDLCPLGQHQWWWWRSTMQSKRQRRSLNTWRIQFLF